ncbi:MAG: DNA methyltransferase [Actinomycetota bacterium]
MTVTRHTGDVLDVLATLPDATVDLVATSPPFLALRNYNDLPGQWGNESDPAAFLDRLLTLATKCRRVLAPHGSIAVELGDTYSGSGGGGGDYHPGGLREGQIGYAGSEAARRAGAHAWRRKHPESRAHRSSRRRDQAAGILPADHRPGPNRRDEIPGWPMAKSLCLVPTLFAASLAYGHNLLNPTHTFERWRVRNVIVWARNNPAPGALADKYRPATTYITVATTTTDRWFDLDAVRHPNPRSTETQRQHRRQPTRGGARETNDHITQNPAGAPPLDYWTDHEDQGDGDLAWLVNTQGSSLAHYAMWPPRLAERLVLSMCPAQVCQTCGQPRRRQTTTSYVDRNGRAVDAGGASFVDHTGPKTKQGRRLAKGQPHLNSHATTDSWTGCGHDNYRPGHVLDPFAGTGTTLAVADIWGRDATGIDLDPANHDLYEHRYAQVWRQLGNTTPSPITPHGQQLTLTDTTQ